jgi:Tfp pilus assembly protein PilN
MNRIGLNLATSPLRNRRLYFFLGGLLGLGILVSALLAGTFFFRFTLRTRVVKAELRKVDSAISEDRKEQSRLAARTREAAKRDRNKVDLVNSIILKKSFPWTDFLASLEECLPDSSYILSLSPTLLDDSNVQVRFKVVSRNLEELLTLINNLESRKFNPRSESEERNNRGELTSEITISYERNI